MINFNGMTDEELLSILLKNGATVSECKDKPSFAVIDEFGNKVNANGNMIIEGFSKSGSYSITVEFTSKLDNSYSCRYSEAKSDSKILHNDSEYNVNCFVAESAA